MTRFRHPDTQGLFDARYKERRGLSESPSAYLCARLLPDETEHTCAGDTLKSGATRSCRHGFIIFLRACGPALAGGKGSVCRLHKGTGRSLCGPEVKESPSVNSGACGGCSNSVTHASPGLVPNSGDSTDVSQLTHSDLAPIRATQANERCPF